MLYKNLTETFREKRKAFCKLHDLKQKKMWADHTNQKSRRYLNLKNGLEHATMWEVTKPCIARHVIITIACMACAKGRCNATNTRSRNHVHNKLEEGSDHAHSFKAAHSTKWDPPWKTRLLGKRHEFRPIHTLLRFLGHLRLDRCCVRYARVIFLNPIVA